MSDVYIVSACRTAIGSFQGQFERHTAMELGEIVIKEAINRAKLEPKDVEQCIMGQVFTAGQRQNPARQAALAAGIPESSTAFTLNMLCGSGLKSIALGCASIKNQDADIIVAGGMESMTKAQHSAYVRGSKLGNLNLTDSLLTDGLTDACHNIHMGITAENLATKYNIPREVQDKQALHSQNLVQEAITSGYFDKEIVPVTNKKSGKIFNRDEYPKFDTTLEKLSRLEPCFIPKGTVTPGNASGINDGAAAVVIISSAELAKRNLTPLAKIVGYAEAGCDAKIMGIGPVYALEKLFKKIGWTKDDVDLFELNEAFAAQAIAVNQTLGLDVSKVNVTGGAIALGHPLAASGTRVLVTLIYNLQRLNKKRGVASLCIGGGMGIAMAIELC